MIFYINYLKEYLNRIIHRKFKNLLRPH